MDCISPQSTIASEATDLLIQYSQLGPEDAYLSYHDIRVLKQDVDTLKNDWLTDTVIAWYEEVLEHEVLSQYPNTNVVLLRPTMVYMLLHTPDPETIKSALPSLTSTTHIFLPINDNPNINAGGGGSHWSLLVVSIPDKISFHYDSLHSMNEDNALKVSDNLGKMLGIRLEFKDLEDSPQQVNMSDCGVHTCLNMRHLLVNRLLKRHKTDKVRMSMGGTEVNAAKGRRMMLDLMESQRKEGQRRSLSAHGGSRSKSKSRSPPRID